VTAGRTAHPIGVVGVGYVGLVTAACFADLGYRVVCRDIDPARVAALREGRVPIYEPGIDRLLDRNRGRLEFTLDMADVFDQCRVVFVCVDTPPTHSGDADLSRVGRVIAELPDIGERFVIVMKSTVPVGTGEKVRAELDARGLGYVGYVSNPEFLREGRAIADFLEPDRIVIGAFDEADGDAVADLYGDIDAPIVRTDVASAEMIKYASNAFLATKISFINEIANVCEEVGADVSVVAQGMGLDERIGGHFLRPGIGYGGSCLVGSETVLARVDGAVRLLDLATLYRAFGGELEDEPAGIAPAGLEVLSWTPGAPGTDWRPVSAITRRRVDRVVDVRTKMGRRLRCTPDHPCLVFTADGRYAGVKDAGRLTTGDWLPVAQGGAVATGTGDDAVATLAGASPAGLADADVIVRVPDPVRAEVADRRAIAVRERTPAPLPGARLYDVARAGALHLDEALRLELRLDGATFGTAHNGTYVPSAIPFSPAFWRVVGLYIAEGCITRDGSGRERLYWHFHPDDEPELVDEVAQFWTSLGVKATVQRRATTTFVAVSSRLLAGVWTGVLGLGRSSYDQRLPDAIWARSDEEKLALLSGAWQGDGSWSAVAGGPSVVLEWGTVSRELADGVLRLLGDLGAVARLKVGRTAKSTRDTYRVVVSGADQVEALAALVKARDRDRVRGLLAAQAKRIAPTGYRRAAGAALVRVTAVRELADPADVYSLEVPGAETFVTSHGLVVHNCFPKDVRALKQLAGNSGYHFQLLTAVIEVNELQKRRVVGKLQRHLGSLRGKRIALLGLAFKANTDDMREASSLVLAARLRAEGADVVAYDPVAMPAAAPLLGDGVGLASSVLDAVTGAHAAVIVTEWGEFRTLAAPEVRAAMAHPLIVDGRNLLDRAEVQAAGFEYESVGRPAGEPAPAGQRA
jgi:UDPglucose 6-dehydrogenase